MFFAPRSEAESEVDHGDAERVVDLAHMQSERGARSGVHQHLLAEGWNAVGAGCKWEGGIVGERKEVEGSRLQQEDDSSRCADEQVDPHLGRGGGGGCWALLLLSHESKRNSQKRRQSDNSEKSCGFNDNINHNHNKNHFTTNTDHNSSSSTCGSKAQTPAIPPRPRWTLSNTWLLPQLRHLLLHLLAGGALLRLCSWIPGSSMRVKSHSCPLLCSFAQPTSI